MLELDLTAPVEHLAAQLIDVASVSGNERHIADAVETALAAHPHLEVTRDGDAIVARTQTGTPERVIIAGHLDTVPIKSNVPHEFRDNGQTLWGRGSVDMKSGLAVMLSLAAILDRPRRDVTWIFYDHEEVEEHKSGLGRLVRNYPELITGDFAVLCEPSSGVIEGGCQGVLRTDVTFTGLASHSARGWKGSNAIHMAAGLLERLATTQPDVMTVDGLEYRQGLNAVGVRGGIAGNVIPDSCVVTVDYRFAPALSLDDAKAWVTALLADVYDGTDIAPGIDWVDESPSARPGLTAPIAREFVEVVQAINGSPPRAKLGWTDVARFGALGIPAVNYGPGDPELAHTDNENCPVSDIHACRTALKAWLTE